MFQLTEDEQHRLRFQIETSKKGSGGRRYAPYAFTEEGVAMLSSVLNSKRAILVNIEIMRTFSRLREMILNHRKIWERVLKMEKKYDQKDGAQAPFMRNLYSGTTLRRPRKPAYALAIIIFFL